MLPCLARVTIEGDEVLQQTVTIIFPRDPLHIQEKSVKLCKLAAILEYKSLCKIILASTKKCSCLIVCRVSDQSLEDSNARTL